MTADLVRVMEELLLSHATLVRKDYLKCLLASCLSCSLVTFICVLNIAL